MIEPNADFGEAARQIRDGLIAAGGRWHRDAERFLLAGIRPVAALIRSRSTGVRDQAKFDGLLLGVFGQQVGFQIDAAADAELAQASCSRACAESTPR